VTVCPRCGDDHGVMRFNQFFNVPHHTDMNRWALCPRTGEPILSLVCEPEIEGRRQLVLIAGPL
jgi:hypothetical protein